MDYFPPISCITCFKMAVIKETLSINGHTDADRYMEGQPE